MVVKSLIVDAMQLPVTFAIVATDCFHIAKELWASIAYTRFLSIVIVVSIPFHKRRLLVIYSKCMDREQLSVPKVPLLLM